MIARYLLIGAVLLAANSALAREPQNLSVIHRETKIVADVMKSALRSELRQGVRVTSVTAEYLANQGVLVSVNLNAPWLVINDGDSAIEINGQINLQEIPTMVENILADLHIDVTPYEPEALEALRDMRAEQRELRAEQREIRGKLREARRDLVRAEDRGDRKDAEEEITGLERELAGVDAQHDALAKDIDLQYRELRDYRGGPSEPAPPATPQNDLNDVVARTVCDYGGTLRSLSTDDFLTVALRRDENTEYFAFDMDDVFSCSEGDIRADAMLERAYQYSG
jgi:hypothetical protein